MNLSLYKLRKQLKRDKSGQGSLVAVALGGIVLSTLVASATSWYLTMRNNLGNTEDKLEAQTIAQSEWERLSHMSLDELEANRNALKTPYSAGTGSQFSISVNLGEKGTFNNGTCGNVSGGYANCFKNTTITVYRDGNRMFTTRTLPLMAGDYTRKEIDAKLSAEASARSNKDTDLQNQINNLTARLNGKEFIKNKTPNYDLNLRYEKKAGEDKFTLHAYNGNTEIPLASQGGDGGGFPNKKISYYIDFNTPAGEYELFSINHNYNGGGGSPQLLTIKQNCWAYVTITTTTYKPVAVYNGTSVDISPETNTYWQPLLKGDILTIFSSKYNNYTLEKNVSAKYIIYPIEK